MPHGRRPPHGRVRYLGVDLLDGPAVAKALQGVPQGNPRVLLGAGQVRRGRRRERGGQRRHAAQRAGCGRGELRRASQHVHLVEGGKWYGQHLGAYPTPAKEDDERHMPPNFYYDQEDLLRSRQRGQALEPGRRRAPTSSATSRRGGRATSSRSSAPMPRSAASSACGSTFPGHPDQFRSLTEVTDAGLLARGLAFMATAPACRNQAFNITNGDVVPLAAAVAAHRRRVRR